MLYSACVFLSFQILKFTIKNQRKICLEVENGKICQKFAASEAIYMVKKLKQIRRFVEY